MKNLVLALGITGCALSAFAQGTIVFGNHILNSVVAPIYGPDPANPWAVDGGITITPPEGPPYVWPGAPLGTSAANGDFVGTFTAELWGGVTPSSLAPIPGADASLVTKGFFATANTPVAIPGVLPGSTAVLQLRAWDNQGGTINTWAQAVASGTYSGQSEVFTSLALGGGIVPPPNLVGLTSFNIHLVPEPSIFALAGLGAAVLLIFRRLNTRRGET